MKLVQAGKNKVILSDGDFHLTAVTVGEDFNQKVTTQVQLELLIKTVPVLCSISLHR